MIDTFNQADVPGLIIDMRQNSGGSGFLADQLAAYFFDTPHVVGKGGRYDEALGDFYYDEERPRRFYLPPEEQRYRGAIAVIVAPSCISACEFFSYDMTVDDRAAIVGHYPTAGAGGGVERFVMPGGIQIQFTVGRDVDAEGNIHIEGRGVAPTVDVPVTEETLFAGGDVLLDAAVAFLDETLGIARVE
jgi:C-terminal processing protease CtpA/Prc